MNQILKERGKRGSLYLLYVPVEKRTHISPSKTITIFRISGDGIEILYTLKSERDLHDNVSVYEYPEPREARHNVFKNLCLKGSALFEVDDNEAKLFMANYL